jgi:hypothetical protein
MEASSQRDHAVHGFWVAGPTGTNMRKSPAGRRMRSLRIPGAALVNWASNSRPLPSGATKPLTCDSVLPINNLAERRRRTAGAELRADADDRAELSDRFANLELPLWVESRYCGLCRIMSAMSPNADIRMHDQAVRLGPEPDLPRSQGSCRTGGLGKGTTRVACCSFFRV